MVDIVPHSLEAPAQGSKERTPTDGEVLVERALYTGVGFGVNEASSLWITDQFMYGKNLLERVPLLNKLGKWFSKEGFEHVSEAIAKTFKLADKVAHDGKIITAKARGGNALLMTTLLSGGTLLILPMKWMEDHKTDLVKKANHWLDGFKNKNMSAEQVEARDNEVEQAIACSPRQSWPSLLMGRVVAMASSVASGTLLMGPARNEALMNWSEKTLTGSLQAENARTASHRYARLLSVETYSCAISSIVLELMSKIFAKKSESVHDPVLCEKKNEVIPAAAPPADTNENPTHYSEKIKSGRTQAQAYSLQA
jgi:hypothetical protein